MTLAITHIIILHHNILFIHTTFNLCFVYSFRFCCIQVEWKFPGGGGTLSVLFLVAAPELRGHSICICGMNEWVNGQEKSPSGAYEIMLSKFTCQEQNSEMGQLGLPDAITIGKYRIQKVFQVFPLGWDISKRAMLDHWCIARTKKRWTQVLLCLASHVLWLLL